LSVGERKLDGGTSKKENVGDRDKMKNAPEVRDTKR